MTDAVEIYTDGACSGNPGPGGWGVLIYLPDGRVQEMGGSNEKTTNNAMELLAVIKGLRQLRDLGIAHYSRVFTDSKYVIDGATKWIEGWVRKGWMTASGRPVANQSLWEEILALQKEWKVQGWRLEFQHVKGHSGVYGNERADQIAAAFSQGEAVDLYCGKPKEPEIACPYYLSLVNHELQMHRTWKECEARVQGASGAKFKKIKTPQEELKTLMQWGVEKKKRRIK